MAYSNTGHKRPIEIKIKKTVGTNAPTVVATIFIQDAFTYNSVSYPYLTLTELTQLS